VSDGYDWISNIGSFWGNESFIYRKNVTLSNSGSELTDYQVLVNPATYSTSGLLVSYHFTDNTPFIKDYSSLGNDGTGNFGSTIALWNFDEATGVTAYDSTSNDLDGTVNGGAAWVSGKSGSAIDFDGSTGNVTIAYDAALGLNTYSVGAWVYLDAEPDNGGIVGTRFGGDTTFDFKVRANDIHGDIGDGSGWLNTSSDCAIDVPIGSWHHIMYVVHPNGHEIYYDGTQCAAGVEAGTPLLMKEGQIMGIGHCAGSEYFNGKIDEVIIANKALTTDEVSFLYNTQKATFTEYGTGYNDKGEGIIFNGSVTDQVAVPALTSLTTGEPFTLSAWVYPEATGDYRTIMGYDSTHRLLIASNGQMLSQQDGNFFSAGASDVPDDTWTHVVYWYDGSNEQWYINGEASGSPHATADAEWVSVFKLGQYDNINYPMKGVIDEVRVYDRALSTHEVRGLYNETMGRYDYGDLRFYDSSGNDLDYYFEYDNQTWVKVPSIPNGNNYLTMYYGYLALAGKSNPENTFNFFDDFSSPALNVSKWTTTGTPTVANGELGLSGSGVWATDYAMTDDSVLESVVNVGAINIDARFGAVNTADKFINEMGNSDIGFNHLWWTSGGFYTECCDGSCSSNEMNRGAYAAGYKYVNNTFDSGTSVTYKLDSATYSTADWASEVPTAAQNIHPMIYSASGVFGAKYIRVRKSAVTEPSVSVGTEQLIPNCCGDGVSDNFYNGTLATTSYFCVNGVYINQTIDFNETACNYYYDWLNTEGLVAHWNLDEGTGSVVKSDSGTFYGAFNNMEEADWVAGKFSTGLNFDGGGEAEYVSVPYAVLPTFSSISVSAWIKPDEVANGVHIITRYAPAGIQFTLYKSANVFSFYINGGGAENKLTGEITLTAGQWYHVVGVFDGTTKSQRLYVNGRQDSNKTYDVSLNNPASNILFGNGGWFGAAENFNGVLDDIKLYNKALTDDEVITVYQSSAYIGCCGDDGVSDDFYNGTIGTTTYFCQDGVFIEQGIDVNQAICTQYSYDWVAGADTGSGYACCGDDGVSDDFYGGDIGSTTDFCQDGIFTEQSIDVNSTVCAQYSYSWFTGSLTGTGDACCGDDGVSDDFYNGSLATTTFFCQDGIFTEQSIDANSTVCTQYSYDWVAGADTGSGYACCGDDGVSDDFYGGDISSTTDFCQDGIFTEQSIDANSTVCSQYSYDWVAGADTGSGYACCGDDLTDDDFYNGTIGSTTYFCQDGIFTEQSIDVNSTVCEQYSYDWIDGADACCGDDLTADDFYSGIIGSTTTFCQDGIFTNQSIDYNKTICEQYLYDWISVSDGLVAHWRFDESTGTIASEESGNYYGSLNNMEDGDWVAGKYGNALDFDGSNEYISIGNPVINTPPFSVCVWVKPDAIDTSNYYVLTNGAETGSYYGTAIILIGSNYRFYGRLPGSSYAVYAVAPAPGTDWTYICGSWAGEGNNADIYINGEWVAEGVPYSSEGGSAYNMLIGQRTQAADNNWAGLIDEIRLYNRVITNDEVRTLYQSSSYHGCCGDDGTSDDFYNGTIGSTTTFCQDGIFTEQSIDVNQTVCTQYSYNWINITNPPVGYWNLDEGTGLIIYDETGNNNLISSGTPAWTTGKYGNATEFDASGDYFVKSLPTGLPSGDVAKSMSAWFILDPECTTSKACNLGGFGNTANGQNFQFDFGPDEISIFGWSYSYDWHTGVAASTYSDGNWHQIMITYDGTRTTLYLDNELKASTTGKNWNTNPQKMIIGEEIDEDGRYFVGKIDDFSIYNFALSRDEVASIYQSSPYSGCCGDDGLNDDFFNNTINTTTTFCQDGIFTEQEIDVNQTICETYVYNWLLGTTTGDYARCCGDDAVSDVFFNGSLGSTADYCYLGVLNTGVDSNQSLCEYYSYDWLSGATGANTKCCGDDSGEDWTDGAANCCCNAVPIGIGYTCDTDEDFVTESVCGAAAYCDSDTAPIITLSDQVINSDDTITISVTSECQPNVMIIYPNLTETQLTTSSCGADCYSATFIATAIGYYQVRAFNGEYDYDLFLAKNSSLVWTDIWTSNEGEMFRYRNNIDINHTLNHSRINQLISIDMTFNQPTYCEDVNGDSDYNDVVDKLGLRLVNNLPNSEYYEVPMTLTNVNCGLDNNLTSATINFVLNLPENDTAFSGTGNYYSVYYGPFDYNVKSYAGLDYSNGNPRLVNNSVHKVEYNLISNITQTLFNYLTTNEELQAEGDVIISPIEYDNGTTYTFKDDTENNYLIDLTPAQTNYVINGMMNADTVSFNQTYHADSYYFTFKTNITLGNDNTFDWLKHFELNLNKSKFTTVANSTDIYSSDDTLDFPYSTRWITLFNNQTGEGIAIIRLNTSGNTASPVIKYTTGADAITISNYPIYTSTGVNEGDSFSSEYAIMTYNYSLHQFESVEKVWAWLNTTFTYAISTEEVSFDIARYFYDAYVDRTDEQIVVNTSVFSNTQNITALHTDIYDIGGNKTMSENYDCVLTSNHLYECNFTLSPLTFDCKPYNISIYGVGVDGNTTATSFMINIDDLSGTYLVPTDTMITTNQELSVNYEYCSGNSSPDNINLKVWQNDGLIHDSNLPVTGAYTLDYTNPSINGTMNFSLIANETNYYDSKNFSANIVKSSYSFNTDRRVYTQGSAGFRSNYFKITNPSSTNLNYEIGLLPTGISARFSESKQKSLYVTVPAYTSSNFYVDVFPVSIGVYTIRINAVSDVLADNSTRTFDAIVQTTFSSGAFDYVLVPGLDLMAFALMLIITISFLLKQKL
jgi:hypothetical protein